MLTLSTIHPDYQSVREQFQNYLSGKASWTDLLPTGTGQTLTDFIAAVGAQDQFAIEHAFREAFRTARLDSSIFAQAVLLGVRLGRKNPARMTVTLSRKPADTAQTVVIPAFTQFACSSSLLFNREAIIFETGRSTLECELFEGSIIKHRLGSDGVEWQIFVSTEDRASVSDQDVRVFVNGLPIDIYTRALWHAKGKSGVQDSTSPNGQLILTFGNEQYGTNPQTNDIVDIWYVLTKGASGQNANVAGRRVTISGLGSITGIATSALSGGGDEKKSVFYRKLYPQLFSANERTATTHEEYSAVANSYPGVIDARVLGQRHLAPSDPRWMNLHQVTLLTEGDTTWSAQEWDTFVRWYEQRTMYPSRFIRKDPVPVPIRLIATVHCQGRADLNAVEAVVRQNITQLFAPRPGIIDSNIYQSDLYTTIKNSSDVIEYVTIDSPQDDIIVGVRSPEKLLISEAAGEGQLRAGQYSYAVTAISMRGVVLGETLASNWTSVRVSEQSGAIITWTPQANAHKYRIYGRTGVLNGLLDEVDGSIGRYVDNGLKQPTENTPILNSAGHFYPQLQEFDLRLQYTDRALFESGELK